MTKKRSISYYDQMAARYDQTAIDSGYSLPAHIADQVDSLGFASNCAVLEIGVGTGLILEAIAAHGYRLTGIDGSNEMLEICRKKNLGARLIEQPIINDALSPLGQSFHLVICVGVLEFIKDRALFLSSIAEITESEGVLLLAIRDPELNPSLQVADADGAQIDPIAHIKTGMTVFHHSWSDTRLDLEKAGFSILEERDVLAYKSPALQAEVRNRLVVAKRSLMKGKDRLEQTLLPTLRHWGFSLDPFFDQTVPLILDSEVIHDLERDIDTLVGLTTRLLTLNVLKPHRSAAKFTLGAHRLVNKVKGGFVARPDLIWTNGRPRLIELNVDSSLGGLLQIGVLSELYSSTYVSSESVRFRSPIAFLAKHLAQLVTESAHLCVLLLSRSFSEYYIGVTHDLARRLTDNGIPCKTCYPSELSCAEYLELNGAPIAAIYRMDTIIEPSEAAEELLKLLQASTRTKTALVSDSTLMKIEHKASLADLYRLRSHSADLLLQNEVDVIDRLIVPTRILTKFCPIDGKSRRAHLLENKDNYVLKRIYSYGGGHTFVGRFLQQADWKTAVDAALLKPSFWVIQDYVEPDRIVSDGATAKLMAGSSGRRCVISPFIFDRTIGGFLCRTHIDETEGVLGLASGSKMSLTVIGERVLSIR